MRNRILTLVLAAAVTASAQQQGKRTLAVEAFDFSAVVNYIQQIFGTYQPVTEGIQALMVNRVSKGGKFTVVERKKINTIMKEQDFGASGRVARPTAAKIGKIRAADLILMGDIVVFGRDDTSKRAGGAIVVGGVGVGGAGRKDEYKAVVVMNYRIVDSETSEVIQTGEARGESKRVSKGGGLAILAAGFGFAGASSISSSNFAETIIGEAVVDCADKLAAQVNSQSEGIGAKSIEISTSVANVNGNTLYIAAGANQWVQTGDRFEVSRLGKAIKDPATGEVLDQESEVIGSLVISQVREKVAVGTFSGSKPAAPGDRAEKK